MGKVIKSLPKEQQPRWRVKCAATEEELRAVPDDVLLAVLLRTGCVGLNVSETAMRLRQSYAGLAEMRTMPTVAQLMAHLKESGLAGIGIGEDKATSLVAALELGRRVADAARARVDCARSVRRAADVADLVRPFAEGLEREKFWVVLLDKGDRPIQPPVELTNGTKDGTLVSVPEAFRLAIRSGARSLAAAHNHVTANVTPSEDDRRLTARLAETGKVVGVPLREHVIVSSEPGCAAFYGILSEG